MELRVRTDDYVRANRERLFHSAVPIWDSGGRRQRRRQSIYSEPSASTLVDCMRVRFDGWSGEGARRALDKYDGDIGRIAGRLKPALSRCEALDEDDLRAEGRVAVLEALESYQGYGATERTWVNTRIRQRMIDAIRRFDIRTRAELRLARRYIAGETETDEETNKGQEFADLKLCSLDCPGADGRPLMSRVADRDAALPDEDAYLHERRRHLLSAMRTLTPRQRTVLQLRLFNGMTLREIGTELDITESRASQLQKRAAERLAEIIQGVTDDTTLADSLSPRRAA